jgi:hypothetical protein
MIFTEEEDRRATRDRDRLLERVKRVTREYSTSISGETVDLLRVVWTSMLAAVAASGHHSNGVDGATYAFAHGGRMGNTWSPMPSSPCGRLVATADTMRELAWDSPAATDRKVVARAADLLGRIPKIADDRQRRLICR